MISKTSPYITYILLAFNCRSTCVYAGYYSKNIKKYVADAIHNNCSFLWIKEFSKSVQ